MVELIEDVDWERIAFRIARRLVRTYGSHLVPFEDAVGWAWVGMLRSSSGFDSTKGSLGKRVNFRAYDRTWLTMKTLGVIWDKHYEDRPMEFQANDFSASGTNYKRKYADPVEYYAISPDNTQQPVDNADELSMCWSSLVAYCGKERASLHWKVRSGLISQTEAAKLAGVTHQALNYQWKHWLANFLASRQEQIDRRSCSDIGIWNSARNAAGRKTPVRKARKSATAAM